MAENFEAKKHAWRQVQDGIVLSFVIHPNDLPKALALAPLGTRYMVAVAEIGDDEKPKESDATPAGAVMAARSGVTAGETAPKERRPFASLPLAQQAGIRCSDQSFQEWVMLRQGVVNIQPSEQEAARYIRSRCSIPSRSDLNIAGNIGPRGIWQNIEAEYQSWLTTQQYAESRRA